MDNCHCRLNLWPEQNKRNPISKTRIKGILKLVKIANVVKYVKHNHAKFAKCIQLIQ